ncbi:MAG TPA: hypothetical protein VFV50_08445 [Bdellovibrionales bacterium]|nr:hypothetical protein [Bdellovibrionales bacterium]
MASNGLSALPRILRWVGAVALLASGVSFMLEGWTHLNSVEKYSAFFGFSLAVAGIGWSCRRFLGDETGAKMLLGIAGAAATVNFVQLGAFFYASISGAPVALPEFLQLQAPEWKSLILLTVVTIAGSVPILWSAFRALEPAARADTLAATSLLLNSAFLLPTRESDHMAALVLGGALLTSHAFKRVSGTGLMTKLLALVPIAVLAGRSLFYPVDHLFYACISFIAFALMFTLPRRLETDRSLKALFETSSCVPLIAGWINVNLAYTWIGGLETFLLISASLLALSFFVTYEGHLYRSAASVLGALAFVPEFVSGFELRTIVLSLLVPAGFAVLGYARRERCPFVAGVSAGSLLLLHHLWNAVRLHELNLWFILGVIGVIIVIVATIIEKKRGVRS